jgi:O-antigen ligase
VISEKALGPSWKHVSFGKDMSKKNVTEKYSCQNFTSPHAVSKKIRWQRRSVGAALVGFALFSPWSIAGAQICLGIGLLAWVVGWSMRPHRPFIRSPLFWPMATYLGIQLLSVLLSPDVPKGFRAFGAEWIILLYFLVINSVDGERQARRLVDVLVLATALISLYAIWQHWAGWDIYRQRPLRATGSVFEATGLFGHHLTFGGYIMMVLILSGSLFLFSTRGRRKVAYGLSSLLLAVALLFSYARSAWLGCVAGVLAIALLRGRKGLMLVLAGVAVVIVVAALFLPSVRQQTGEVVTTLKDPAQQSSRLQMWMAAVPLIGDHPLLGAGVGQASDLLPKYGCDLGYGHLHNDILNVAANSGLLGLAAFLWIWITFVRFTRKCDRLSQVDPWSGAMAMAGFGIVISFLVAGLFQCYYTDAEDGMVLWFLLGLVVTVCIRKERPAGPQISPIVCPVGATEDREA